MGERKEGRKEGSVGQSGCTFIPRLCCSRSSPPPSQVNEKLTQLERLRTQYTSLQNVAQEQETLIEKLSNNET